MDNPHTIDWTVPIFWRFSVLAIPSTNQVMCSQAVQWSVSVCICLPIVQCAMPYVLQSKCVGSLP